MPKKPRPDVRIGGLNDPSAWSPARAYAHVCRLKRRVLGRLCLSKEEFRDFRDAYVERATGPWRRSLIAPPTETAALNAKGRTAPRRTYIRDKRQSVFDDPSLGKDWRFREMRFREELAAAEFAYIILRGEYGALKASHRNAERAWAMVQGWYGHLPQAAQGGMPARLESAPALLATEELGAKYQIAPDSIPVLLSPSKRCRAGMPPEWFHFLKRLPGDPTR